MALFDDWSFPLRCPNCGRVGTATIHEETDGSAIRVVQLSDGFVTVNRPLDAGTDVRCTNCNRSALE
jgi:phage FluMu protein Com